MFLNRSLFECEILAVKLRRLKLCGRLKEAVGIRMEPYQGDASMQLCDMRT